MKKFIKINSVIISREDKSISESIGVLISIDDIISIVDHSKNNDTVISLIRVNGGDHYFTTDSLDELQDKINKI